MGEPDSPRPARWPTIVSIVTIVYCAVYSLDFLRSGEGVAPTWRIWKIAAVASLLLGSVGLLQRKPWGRRLLLAGSCLVLVQAAQILMIVIQFTGWPLPFFVLLGLLTGALPLVGWPVFLLIWLSRKSIEG